MVGYNATAYTESFFRITVSLMNRGTSIQTPDFPPAPYIENIGVRPDIASGLHDPRESAQRGAPYIEAFTAAIENLVQGSTSTKRPSTVLRDASLRIIGCHERARAIDAVGTDLSDQLAAGSDVR